MNHNNLGELRRQKNRMSGIKIMCFSFCTTVLGILGILFLTSKIGMITSHYETIIEEDYLDISYMDQIGQLIYEHEALVFRHMSTEDEAKKDVLQEQAGAVEGKIQEILYDFGKNMKGREYETYYHNIYSGVGGYFKNIDVIFALSDQGDIRTAEYYMDHALLDCIGEVNANAQELTKITTRSMNAKRKSMKETILFSRISAIMTLIILTIFGLTSNWLCGRLTHEIISIDPLTNIMNADCCENYMQKLYRKKKLFKYTCILINLKDFSYINKSFSSEVGDSILSKYAATLQKLLQSDEVVSRQGGDSFLVLLRQERAETFLQELLHIHVTVLIEEGEKTFKIVSRCGIYPIQPGDTVSDVMNCASMTLNNAKYMNKMDQVWFAKEQYEHILQDKKVLSDFKKGLKNKEFTVYYQPKVDAKSNRLCGCEALVRWIKDDQVVPPGSFIPVLEKEGKVVELDFYVFEQVCKDIAEWLEKGIEPVRVSTNFSKLHLRNKHLVEDVLEVIDKYKIDSRYLELELTESSGYENLVMLKYFVDKMTEANIYTSMDDFGTGYSSLSMLKDVDVNVVKLDKSFLKGVNEGDEAKEKMISHLVEMIQDLDRTVVCEGVETEKELEFLKSISCDMIQGFLFDKPLPHKEFEKRLQQPAY